MLKPAVPQKILCIHDLSGLGRCSLSVILPVLAVMGQQPVALPTMLLSTHTGGLGAPATLDCAQHSRAALRHYGELGFAPDCIYTGYLGGEAQADVAAAAFAAWPQALKVVDPVLGDGGVPYAGVTPGTIDRVRELCRAAQLLLPNWTEAKLLLGEDAAPPEGPVSDEEALALAGRLAERFGSAAVVTGVPMGKYIACAGVGKESFLVKKPRIDRSFPGTGDLFAAIVTGSLARGNVLSAAADAAAGFTAQAIQNTPRDADPRYGVCFEPLLSRLAPQGEY